MADDPNLIIEDDYVQTVGTTCKKRGEVLDNAMHQYLSILKKISNDALVSGAQHDALEAFISVGETLYAHGKIKEVSHSFSTSCTNFIEQVDRDDSFLY